MKLWSTHRKRLTNTKHWHYISMNIKEMPIICLSNLWEATHRVHPPWRIQRGWYGSAPRINGFFFRLRSSFPSFMKSSSVVFCYQADRQTENPSYRLEGGTISMQLSYSCSPGIACHLFVELNDELLHSYSIKILVWLHYSQNLEQGIVFGIEAGLESSTCYLSYHRVLRSKMQGPCRAGVVCNSSSLW